jgi:hypothetical protein
VRGHPAPLGSSASAVPRGDCEVPAARSSGGAGMTADRPLPRPGAEPAAGRAGQAVRAAQRGERLPGDRGAAGTSGTPALSPAAPGPAWPRRRRPHAASQLPAGARPPGEEEEARGSRRRSLLHPPASRPGGPRASGGSSLEKETLEVSPHPSLRRFLSYPRVDR